MIKKTVMIRLEIDTVISCFDRDDCGTAPPPTSTPLSTLTLNFLITINYVNDNNSFIYYFHN